MLTDRFLFSYHREKEVIFYGENYKQLKGKETNYNTGSYGQ